MKPGTKEFLRYQARAAGKAASLLLTFFCAGIAIGYGMAVGMAMAVKILV